MISIFPPTSLSSKSIAGKFLKSFPRIFRQLNLNLLSFLFRDHYEYLKLLGEYKDQCLSEKPKQIVAILIYSIKAMINSYCKHPNAQRTKNWLTAIACANTVQHEYQKCQNNYIDTLNTIIPWTDSKEKLAQMCWYVLDGSIVI